MTHGFVVQAANICLDVMSKITAKPDFPVISDNDKAEIKFTAGNQCYLMST